MSLHYVMLFWLWLVWWFLLGSRIQGRLEVSLHLNECNISNELRCCDVLLDLVSLMMPSWSRIQWIVKIDVLWDHTLIWVIDLHHLSCLGWWFSCLWTSHVLAIRHLTFITLLWSNGVYVKSLIFQLAFVLFSWSSSWLK